MRGRSRLAEGILPFLAGCVPILVVLVFTGLPIVLAVLYTFGDTGGLNATVAAVAQHQVVAKDGLTLGAYRAFFDSSDLRADLWATLWITGLSTVILVAVAWVLALFVRFGNRRLGHVASTLYLIPMFIPVVIASYALVTFWEANGRLAALLNSAGITHLGMPGYTSLGVVIGLVWTELPFGVILISAGLQSVPAVLIDAGRDVGASWVRLLWQVLVPLNKIPTLIVLIFTAVGALGSFTIPDLMGANSPQMLGVAMTDYYQSYGEPQMAEVMSVIIFLVALGLSCIYVVSLRSEKRRQAMRSESN